MAIVPSTHVRAIDLEVDAVAVRDDRLGLEGAVFMTRRITNPLLRRDIVRHCSYALDLTRQEPAGVTVLAAGQTRQACRDRLWVR
jgi:hypothetical protein